MVGSVRGYGFFRVEITLVMHMRLLARVCTITREYILKPYD